MKNDALGHALLDYFSGKSAEEYIERNDGLLTTGKNLNTQVYFSEYNEWPELEQRAVRLAHGKILDIGCGAGRHALYLQAKGFDVWGIDTSPLAIKICKKRGLKHARMLDIKDIDKLNYKFDSILLLGNNMALLGDIKKGKQILRKLKNVTNQDAYIFGTCVNPHLTKDAVHLQYQNQNKREGRMPGELTLRIRYKNLVGPWFKYIFMSPRELKDLLRGTGWAVEKVHNSGVSYLAIIKKVKN